MPRSIDLTRKRFSRLVVAEQAGKDKYGKILWLCQCDCGEEKIVQSGHLKSGHTQSCGCLRKDMIKKTGLNNIRHGHTKNKELSQIYISWKNMKARCINPNNSSYENYGGREIAVCERWMNSFAQFTKDMGEHPGSGYSIHRVNNNKGYCRENCRWATKKEQARNKRNNKLISYNGKKQCLAAWAEEYNINYEILLTRIIRLSWSIGRALTTPVRKWRKYE